MKMKIKLEINITNKWLYSLIAIGISLILGVVVYASSIPNPGHGSRDCHWIQVPDRAMEFTCGENEFVAGIGYEDVEWQNLQDTHLAPEINRLYCCKVG